MKEIGDEENRLYFDSESHPLLGAERRRALGRR
jgi:hypothetical protein